MGEDELAVLQRALDLSGIGFTLVDPRLEDFPLVYVNRSFLAMTGYTADEVMGRHCRFLHGPDPAPGTVATRGIVVGDFETAAGTQGFYIQDPDPDSDPLTSEGIFVFTGTTTDLVKVGDAVGVSGFVRERFNQTAIQGSNSNTAAVPASNIAVCSNDNALPPATEVVTGEFWLGDIARHDRRRLAHAVWAVLAKRLL
jgi:hypothetical protein